MRPGACVTTSLTGLHDLQCHSARRPAISATTPLVEQRECTEFVDSCLEAKLDAGLLSGFERKLDQFIDLQ